MKTIIENLDNANIIVIGDLMLDIYYEGDAIRISPEAPVPVVEIEKKRYLLGGAGNVAKNIRSLGAKCTLISCIGEDNFGIEIEKLINKAKIENKLIKIENKCTTVKTRIFARNQQIVRYDEENKREILQKEKDKILNHIENSLEKENSVIILSDYGKGLLYEDIIKDIYEIAKINNYEKPCIIIDPKPINKKYYKDAFCMTPNTREAISLSNIDGHKKEDIIKIGNTLKKELNMENILITLGSEGMALFHNNEIYHMKSTAKQVFDVTGAGDTVIAIFAMAISNKQSLKDACFLATLAAGIVVEKVGSVSTTKEEILNAFLHTKIEEEKW